MREGADTADARDKMNRLRKINTGQAFRAAALIIPVSILHIGDMFTVNM
jgi:hypothetical protein